MHWQRLECCKEVPYLAFVIRSKLTSKAQTTIPHAVRAALRLCAGDEIGYVIEPGRVMLTRVNADLAGDDPFGAFSEWGSVADSEAYADL